MKRVHSRALLAGFTLSSVVALSIFLGSGGFLHFDPALYWYAVGSILAAFAVAYRFTVWAERPPSRMYFIRGLQILLKRGPAALRRDAPPKPATPARSPVVEAGLTLGSQFVAQDFIRRRSSYRWIMHLCLSGGCTLAFAVTFPLVFGWIHFSTPADNAELYQVVLLGFIVDSFHVDSFQAFLMFNLLNISALIVLVGLALAGYRRLTDAGERATQTFAEDILPLLIILAVTVTGLMLTASYALLGGAAHGFLAVVHLLSVLLLLFYIPFGKLFHMFQRSAHLFVRIYKRAGANGEQARCRRCDEEFASLLHVEDLKTVLDQLDFNYRYETGDDSVHYQDICPSCRRKLLVVNQGISIAR